MHFTPVENLSADDDMNMSHGGGEVVSAQLIMNDPLDDVFGAQDDSRDEDHVHPSDMRRLEAEHSTAGYREGIALGKEATLQKGFDEGYPLGAAIGLQAGHLLGMLEAIYEATRTLPNDAAAAKIEQLLVDARADLGVDQLFSSKYWTETGNRSYEVDTAAGEHSATSHPLIRKWTSLVAEEVQHWNIDRQILAHVNPQGPQPLPVEEPEHHEQTPPAANPLEW
jgi:hypothetical protein